MNEQQKQQDLASCERALHELLTAIVEHEERRRAATSAQSATGITVSGLGDVDFERAKFEDLIEDPIRHSLRSGIRKIGKAVYQLTGSIDAMSNLLERVADLNAAWSNRRSSIVDHAWNGIGEGENKWWA